MKEQKESALGKFILRLITFGPIAFRIFSSFTSVLQFETTRTKRNLAILVILFLIFIPLFSITWLCLLAFIFMYFASLAWPLPWCLFAIFMLNVILLSIILILMVKYKNKLLFPVRKFKNADS